MLYWTEWGSTARIRGASMDGLGVTTIHSTDLIRPYSVTVDFDAQMLYWTDNILDKIEASSVNGTGRCTLITSSTLIPQLYSLTVFENNLYFSDWTVGVNSIDTAGQQSPVEILNRFCDFRYPHGIKVVSNQRQPEGKNSMIVYLIQS